MEFDYIIVGAGSAGCVLADRLSAKQGMSVLVIEAGGSDARFWIKVPVGYGYTFSDPRVNWCYYTERDRGRNGQSAFWPRGKVIGGSSSINAMAYVRGLPNDFDDWESAGASGWNRHSVGVVYERLECVSEPSLCGRNRIRGSGPVHVSDLRGQMHSFSRHFLDAAKDLGWPMAENMNGAHNGGITYYRSSVKNGRRCSSADAFLRPALKRCAVALAANALVEKLEISDGRAIGVRYRTRAGVHRAVARREVIVSAGAVNSPQLLQLSGLGSAQLLKSHGIDVVADLPEVGQGLQDHLAITHYFAATTKTLNASLGRRPGQFLAGLRYVLTRKGPLSVPINQVGGFIRSERSEEVPDMQVFCNPASYTIGSDGKLRVDPTSGFTLSVQPCRPSSRGTINVASADPSDPPLIQPNSLTTSKDRDDAVTACKILKALAETRTVSRVTKRRLHPDITAMDDVEMLENFRDRAATNFHPTCTCRMGNDASDSVLDARLRVHGIRGLRVVDASAFPNITSGNTNAPTMMLAMRAADLILEDSSR